MDECAGQNDCAQLCNNNIGGFRCACNEGFVLNEDKKTCRRKLNSIVVHALFKNGLRKTGTRQISLKERTHMLNKMVVWYETCLLLNTNADLNVN